MLFLEGGFYETASHLKQGPKYWWVDPPTDGEIQAMVSTLAYRVIRFLKKKGYFKDDLDAQFPDEEMSQEELPPELQAASVQSRIAMGERRGQKVRRLGSLEPADFHPELKGPLCAMAVGFSLHAEVYCAPWASRAGAREGECPKGTLPEQDAKGSERSSKNFVATSPDPQSQRSA